MLNIPTRSKIITLKDNFLAIYLYLCINIIT